jgi:hypothetical protein
MADNTDEEHLDNPINNQSENTPDEIIPTTDTETINSIQETENMEVHHHAHDPAAPHHKKNWKSYFWEFLMLFLAVFCGFLAEYQLEHKIEKERRRKYMSDMIENLKYDTIRQNRNLLANEIKCNQLDSFRAAISKAIKGDIDGNNLYDLWLKTQNFNQVVFNRASITQLKNAGGFRLINNDALAKSISDYYDRIITANEAQEANTNNVSQRLEISSLRFFYYEPFGEMLKTETQFGKPIADSVNEKNNKPLMSNPPLALLNTNPTELKLLYNDVATKEKAIKNYNSFIRWAKESAEALMIQIEEEYHFKK